MNAVPSKMLKLAPNKILIVRLSALGDVIQTLPVLSMLRQQYPDATIGWLVEADAAELLINNPLLDIVHVSHRKRWNNLLANPFQWGTLLGEVWAFMSQIHKTKYDVALDFQGLSKSSITMALTGAKHRIGFACARELAPLLYTEKIASPTREEFFSFSTPIINHFIKLAETLCPSVTSLSYPLPPVTKEAQQKISHLLMDFNNNQPVIAIAPATQWMSKHWPLEYWTKLVKMILENTSYNIVVIGGKKDTDLIETILSPIDQFIINGRFLNLAGMTSLKELHALLMDVNAVIGPDSFPIHLAGAIGKSKVLGIYGPTAHKRTPPPGDKNVTLLTTEGILNCQPCDQSKCPLGTMECMIRLTPDRIFTALISTLENSETIQTQAPN